jgi:predicted nucleotidyltransferase
MPVRSLNSSVLKWPDRDEVVEAVRDWARDVAEDNPTVLGIGYFGSYARGNWGVGSDLDLVIVLSESDERFERRGLQFDATELPVPADLLVYTEEELNTSDSSFIRDVREKTAWVYTSNESEL